MKRVVGIFLLTVGLKTASFCQIPEVEIKDDRLRDCITQYIKEAEFLLHGQYGCVVVSFVDYEGNALNLNNSNSIQDSLSFSIWSTHHEYFLSLNPPSFYSIIDELPIVIYTGVEALVSYGNNDIIKVLKKYLPPSKNSDSILPDVWHVKIFDENINIEKM